MGKSVRALINPKLLIWARETASLDLFAAAEKISVDSEELAAWEEGKSYPTFNQLIKLSKLYKRSLPIFYLSNVPKNFMPLRDYRKLPDTASSFNESPQLSLEIRKSYYRRQIALELSEMLGEELPNLDFRITINDSPEIIGEKLRELLDIKLEDQISWKNDYDALNEWRTALERIGVMVFQSEKIKVNEMRGFSIGENPLPVIVINKKDTPKGRIFSMLHEFTHVLMGENSISGDNIENYFRSKEGEVETFCNYVAAAALLPLSAFQNDKILANYENQNEWNDSIVLELSKRFNVSRECFWRRLLTRRKITYNFYMEKRKELLNDFASNQKKQKQNIPIKYHFKVLSSIGTFYTELVLNSYYRDKITSSTLSEYLGVKLKHIPTIENAIFGHSR